MNHPTPPHATPWPVLSQLRGAQMIVETAQANQLPAPYDVDARFDRVQIVFADVADLNAWTAHYGLHTTVRDVLQLPGATMHEAEGRILDVPVHLAAVDRLPEVTGAAGAVA